MKTPVDVLFLQQSERFRLKLFCEDCAHFESASETCAEGFPNQAHRRVSLELVSEVVFCKSFELC